MSEGKPKFEEFNFGVKKCLVYIMHIEDLFSLVEKH